MLLVFFLLPQNQAVSGSIRQYLTAAKNEKPAKLRIFNVTSRVLYGAREGTRTPKDKPHAPQTCASASSATLAYSVRTALRTSEVESRLCGLLEYSTTFAGNRQAFFGFFIDFFGVHILIEPTKIQKQHAREVLACVCLYHVCGGCFWGRVSLRVWQLLLRPECAFRRAVRLSAHRRI